MTAPFKSKFIPYVEDIKKWRRAGNTWQEVAEKLMKEKGVKADAGNVCRVMARIKRRPYPLGAEPEPDQPKSLPSKSDAEIQNAKKEEEDAYEKRLEELKNKPQPKLKSFND
jgi:hypothetical protein